MKKTVEQESQKLPLDPRIIKAMSDKFGKERADKFVDYYNDFVEKWAAIMEKGKELEKSLRKTLTDMEEVK